jgi:hypothetical protein
MDGAEFRADRALAAKIVFGYLGPADLRCKNVTGIVFRGDGQQVGGWPPADFQLGLPIDLAYQKPFSDPC